MLGQVDQSTCNWGRGAIRMPDGKIGFHLGDRLLMAGQEYELNDVQHTRYVPHLSRALTWRRKPQIGK